MMKTSKVAIADGLGVVMCAICDGSLAVLALSIAYPYTVSMRILTARAHEFAEILALNDGAVPNVNKIDNNELRWFADNAAYLKVARFDNDVAAFLVGLRPGSEYASLNYRWFCDHYDDFAYVDRIVVAESARRRGVADMMYRDFAASQPGAPRMTCEVNIRPPNPVSMRFHSRHGFRQVGSRQYDNGTKEVALLEKLL